MANRISLASSGSTQTQRGLTALRDLILGGTLAAGTRLYEESLARQFGISRTPLREAIGMLEHEGLLERGTSRGHVVRKFSIADVRDAIELRGVLEGTVARLAAERGVNPSLLDEMNDVVVRIDRTVFEEISNADLDDYIELNSQFHGCLHRMSGSEVLEREVRRISTLPLASPSAFLDAQWSIPEFRSSLFTAQRHHRDLVEAVSRREGSRAEHVAREHARLALRNLEYFLDHQKKFNEKVPGLALVSGN